MLALDGDKAGRRGTIKIAEFLKRFRREVYVACVPDGEDINSMALPLWQQMLLLPYDEWLDMIKKRFKWEFEDTKENQAEDLEEDLD